MSATQQLLRFGAFEVNVTTGELRKSGKVIKLPPLSFRLLVLLASRAGQPVSRDEIEKQLWGEGTEVDFEHGLNKCIRQIRDALGDDADNQLYIETLPRFGYRFLAPVVSKVTAVPRPNVVESDSSEEKRNLVLRGGVSAASGAVASATPIPFPAPMREPQPVAAAESTAESTGVLRKRTSRRSLLWAAFTVLLVLAIAGGLYWRNRRATALTEKDTIVVAEFDNQTGDPVFDGTLRQGLSSQLEQSPFLNLLSDSRIAQILALMAQPKGTHLSGALAREVCQRTASAATIEGSISTLGSQYVVGLKAVDCRSGDLLGEEQATAEGKEQVLKALGGAATKLRRKLGESLASVQKYDAPLENATTSSLEALQAYSLGYQAMVVRSDYVAAAPLFQRAIRLDPDFAMAYARLGTNYGNLGETARAAENMTKAYQLRQRASEREKFYIESHYQQLVVGDLEAARKICESWAQTYPRDAIPPDTLSYIYTALGRYDYALSTAQRRFELAPGSALSYGNLVIRNMNVNHLDEARATAREAQAHNIDAPIVRLNAYLLDFLQHDMTGMEREYAAMISKPGQDSQMLYLASDTAAYSGQLAKARELTRRAVASARESDNQETAAEYAAESAVREALVGNTEAAKHQAHAALVSSTGRDVKAISAIAIALAGDSASAKRLAGELASHYPDDTIVQFNYLPTINGASELKSGSAAKAIEALAPAAPYELGEAAPLSAGIANFSLYLIYVRGEAYLAAHQGVAAAAEFQKIVDHSGIVLNEPIGALAHLGLARSFNMQGDITKTRASYEGFFTLWKDADPDVPILKQAKSEYAKLK